MAYRTPRVWYPARVPAKHVGLAYHHKKRKTSTKNIEKIVLDCYYAGFCLFTAPLRISGACISGFTTVSSLVNAAACFFMEWVGFTIRRALSLSLYGMERGIPVESTCCSHVRRSVDYGVCVADCYRDLTWNDECLSRPVVDVCCGPLCC